VKIANLRRLRFLVLLPILFAAMASAGRAEEVVEEIIEQNYPMDPTATFTLHNEDGSVQIYGADITMMKLQAIKKAYSKDRLSRINVNVAVQPGAVRVETAYPPKPKWGLSDRSGTVDYVIILPWHCQVQGVELVNGEIVIEGMRGNEVRARLNNGRLFGNNCFTDLHLSIGSGVVGVGYDWWEAHPIALETAITSGNTWLSIPSEARFRLHAETVNGHVFSDFGGPANRSRNGQTRLDLLIGDGDANAEMKVLARDGSIQIKEYNP
jgi:hypothetical protein